MLKPWDFDTWCECEECGELFDFRENYEDGVLVCPYCGREHDPHRFDWPIGFDPNPHNCIDFTPMSEAEYQRMKL